ncbi:uncharacterized protein UBRO_08566 [Ustilago bromivora]|uniref:t-SNARE coiled-coil homology domain-containing protein n=1 Tax=Ustilago bromivora TaxID=307758 RepID=A0A1K0HCL5_9BASI|nr:uncharacterized protein UBRO_08566 [Ustilago bromivora]
MATMHNIPMSANARNQFQQYLSQVHASSSTSTSSSHPASTDLNALLQHTAHLTANVDELHSQLYNSLSSGNDDPQLFWTTLTLQTNLRSLSAQLQQHRSERKAAEALAKTLQNVDIVESLLRLISVSGAQEKSGDMFTAPIKPQVPTATPTARATTASAQERSYEYWKQQTLSALEDGDEASPSTLGTEDDEDDAASETSSILTDPETPLFKPKSTSHPLAGLSKEEEEEELAQYEKAPKSSSSSTTYPPPPSTASAPTTAAAGGDTTILQSDRATHEALSSELLRMASVLKSNSLAFADSLERDRLLLEKADTDLGQNLDLITRTRGRLGVYSKKARSMGWFTLSAMLVVIVSWMLMFLLIRLT